MGVRFDPDQSPERATGTIVEGILIKEIARGLRRNVVLQRAGVEFLLVRRDRDRQQVAPCPFAYEATQTFEPRIFRTEVQVQTHRRRIVIDRGRVHLQGHYVLSPILRANVSDFGPRAGDQVVYSASEAGRPRITRAEMLYDGNLGQFVSDKQQMRKDRNPFAAQPVKDLDRLFDLDPPWNEKKCSVRDQCLVQRRELGRAQDHRLRHEMFSEEIGVLYHGAFEWLENDAAFLQVVGDDIALDQLIAGKNQARREFVQPARVFQNIGTIIIRKRGAKFKWRKIEKIDTGKTPGLIFAGWPRDRFEFFPRGGLLFPKPIGQIARLNRTRKDSFRAYGFILSD